MPLTAAPAPAPITGLPAPAGGFEFDVAAAQPEDWRTFLAGAQTVGVGKARYVNTENHVVRLRNVHLRVGTAPTGADLIVDVNVDGTTAFSAQTGRPKIVAGQTSGSAVPAQAGVAVDVPVGGVVTIDVDQIGSTVAGSDLNVVVEVVEVAANNREGILY